MCGLPESLKTFAHKTSNADLIFSLVPVSLSAACEQIRVEQNDGCILISLQFGEDEDTQQTANRQTGQKMDLSLTAGRHTLPPSSTGSVLSGGSRTSKPVRKRIGSNRFRRTLGRGEKAKLARHLR